MFEKELAFFKKHQGELVAKYGGMTLVLRGDKVEGVYESALAAFVDASKKFEAGTFMIQRCTPGPNAYTVTISPMNW